MAHKLLTSLLMILLLASPAAFANDDDESDVRDLPRKERIVVGGNIGLQISNINTMVIISPMIGYRLTNRLTPGLGLTYQYYRDRGWGNLAGFTAVTHIYGGNLFLRYHILPQLFAHVEYEALNLDSQMGWQINPDNEARFWEYNYLVGAGYRVPISERAFINLMILYNLNDSSVVYFQNPIFRIGVSIGL